MILDASESPVDDPVNTNGRPELRSARLGDHALHRGVLQPEATFGEHGVALASVNEQLDTSTAGGRFTTGILALVSQWERESIGERTKAALRQRKRDGLHVGRPRYGYCIDGDRLVCDDHAQRTLRRMRKLRRAGWSLRDICGELDRRSFPSPTGRGWTPSTVARLTSAT